ncbi:hypothetical protein QTO34_019895 [Cnephaeus nilssonii]|uniref:Uncharacterized protein n=1 Tax=Cnephaeus nilssonii TaxID=3371016 RepID=A0AA40HXP6_CNENI|nr:hypothetical protein QTO34_019895 [Eptesicus nilssonii]
MVTAILLVDSTDSLPYIGRGPGGKELPVAPAASQQGLSPQSDNLQEAESCHRTRANDAAVAHVAPKFSGLPQSGWHKPVRPSQEDDPPPSTFLKDYQKVLGTEKAPRCAQGRTPASLRWIAGADPQLPAIHGFLVGVACGCSEAPLPPLVARHVLRCPLVVSAHHKQNRTQTCYSTCIPYQSEWDQAENRQSNIPEGSRITRGHRGWQQHRLTRETRPRQDPLLLTPGDWDTAICCRFALHLPPPPAPSPNCSHRTPGLTPPPLLRGGQVPGPRGCVPTPLAEAPRPAPAPGRLLTVPVHRVAFSLGQIHLVEAAPHTHPLDVHQLLHLGLAPGGARDEAAGAVLVVLVVVVVPPEAGGRARWGGPAAHMATVRGRGLGWATRGLQQGPEGELDAERVVADEGLPGLLVLLVEPAHLLRAQLRHHLVAVPGGRAAGPGALPLPETPSRSPAAPRVRRHQRRRLRRLQGQGAAAAALALAVVAQRGAGLGRAEVIVLVTEAGV